MNLYESANKWLDKLVLEDAYDDRENPYEKEHHARSLGKDDGSVETKATIQVVNSLRLVAQDYVRIIKYVAGSNLDDSIKKEMFKMVLNGGGKNPPSLAFINALIDKAYDVAHEAMKSLRTIGFDDAEFDSKAMVKK